MIICSFLRFNKIDNESNTETHEQVVIESIGFFKDSIEPSWEDPKNKNGGEIQIEFKGIEIAKVN